MHSHLKYFHPLTCLLFVFGCLKNDGVDQADGSISKCSEVESLDAYSERNEYLEFLFQEDQKYRLQSGDVSLQYGYDSEELKDLYGKMVEGDERNKQRVNCYLAKFGYPESDSLSDIANSAIPTVIHHSADTTWKRNLFPTLYEAYHRGNLDAGGLTFILNRMYQFRHGERLVMESPFHIQEEIDTLIQLLELKVID